MESTICTKCGVDKNINGFVKKRTICKKCVNNECKLYKQKNKEKISEYNKLYKNEHKESIKEYNKQYNINNRKTIQKRHTAYLKIKRRTDPQYKVSVSLRNRINKVINGQNKIKTLEMLGCSYKLFVDWITFQFEDNMTLENHGSVWHIDHIIPCNAFDLTNQDEIKKCFNWTNMKPMHAHDNMAKKHAISKEIDENIENIKKFIKVLENKNEIIPNIPHIDKKTYIKKQ